VVLDQLCAAAVIGGNDFPHALHLPRARARARQVDAGTELLRLQAELAGDLSKVAVAIRQSTTTIHNTLTFTQSPMFGRLQRNDISILQPNSP
jgi:hypothetical protein